MDEKKNNSKNVVLNALYDIKHDLDIYLKTSSTQQACIVRAAGRLDTLITVIEGACAFGGEENK